MTAFILLFLSVAVGIGLGYLIKPDNKNSIKLLLSFSGAYLFAIVIFHLLPELYQPHNHFPEDLIVLDDVKTIGLFIAAGFLFQIVLEFFSGGVEHGHIHTHNYREGIVPFSLYLSLCIHALFEGMPLDTITGNFFYGGCTAGEIHSHDSSLLYGIVLHKIPVSMMLFAFFRQLKIKTSTNILLLFVFALMAPLGMFIAEFIPQNHTYITAIVTGIFLHISTTILFESSANHRFNLIKIATVIGATLLAWATL